jgi:uncharacterized UBP type Zn finger protein
MSDALQTLIEFGIPMEKASFALAAKNQNLEAAIAWCFDEVSTLFSRGKQEGNAVV